MIIAFSRGSWAMGEEPAPDLIRGAQRADEGPFSKLFNSKLKRLRHPSQCEIDAAAVFQQR